MTKKAMPEAGKKDAILAAALETFLEKGYESTSVRNISQKVGCEVGLIYYYFKTKEELFDRALETYYEKTEQEMQEIAAQSDASMEKFVDYLEKKAISYKKSFADNVHFSIRATVREKITALATVYLTAILEKNKKENAKSIAVFLAGGLCGAILHDEEGYYTENKEAVLKIAENLTEAEPKKRPLPEKETPPAPVVQRKREIPSFLL
ncbi:MAG: TetR/AcrR family transcriptional regulator [Clostridia bacterium]|nr:TetR/AcrR family transcriptional regulator [Clostridia bacterium]